MTELIVSVNAQSDDAQEEDGGYTNIADIFLKMDTDYDYIGMVFDSISIAQGATIDDATLAVYPTSR